MRLTLATLESWGACAPGLDAFESLVPDKLGLLVEGEPPEEFCARLARACDFSEDEEGDLDGFVDWLSAKAWEKRPANYEGSNPWAVGADSESTHAAWLAQIKALWRLLALFPEVL